MFFEFRNRNKTIKELRKDCYYTAKELAVKIKVDDQEIFKIDNMKLKEIPLPIKTKLLPILRNDYMNNIPW
ncbi:hypothetical protein [Ammoniphilus resinae]|uniref:DNA-binding XRE family transcriptional regulator n=1 Tax=Ammoniphilus resinae TaxID=861532 RepID=A0ABS4GY26_9BACL|nr:hypothetical protein [Ammoniphilus resinae]MBP1934780.1 DNA-binding XRE family transcriptional regulator [Ammoniphilus resinae]